MSRKKNKKIQEESGDKSTPVDTTPESQVSDIPSDGQINNEQVPSEQVPDATAGNEKKTEGDYVSGDSRNKRLHRVSSGEVRTGVKAAFLSALLNHQEDLEITVPVDSIGETYLYNFKSVLENYAKGSNLSVSERSITELARNILEFQKVLGMIYSVAKDEDSADETSSFQTRVINQDGRPVNLENWLSDEILKPGKWYDKRTATEVVVTGDLLERLVIPLKTAGLSTTQINTLLKLSMEQLDRSLVRNSFVPAALRHSLETKMFEFEKYDDPEMFSRQNVVSTIGNIQTIYSRACLQLALEVFSQELSDVISSDQRLKFVANMNRFFKESPDTSMPVRFSAVMEEIAPALGQDSLIEGHSVAQGLGYIIDKIHPDLELDDVPRTVWVEFVFKLIRDYTRIQINDDSWSAEAILTKELALNPAGRIWHIGLPPEIIAGRPTKAEAFYDSSQLEVFDAKLEAIFKRIFVRALFKVIGTRQEGLLKGRMLSVLDERAITRSDTWDYVVTSGINAMSCFHQAFIDTFVFFLEIARCQDIHMADDNTRFTPLLLEYFDKQCDVFRRTYTPTNEPSHLREGSSLFLGINPVPLKGEIHFAYEDDVLLDYDESNLDVFSSKYKYLYASPVISGDRFAIPAHLSEFEKKAYQWPEYSKIIKPLHVRYFMIREIDSEMLGTDLIQSLLRYQDIRGFYKEKLGRWFQDKCEARVFLDADEMHRELDIPLPVAEQLFETSAGAPLGYQVMFKYTGPLQQYIFFAPDVCPVFELGEKRDDDPRFYERFKAYWPALVSGEADETVRPIYRMGYE